MAAPCIYCRNPCVDEMIDMEHKPSCPFTTNLWPVLAQDVEPHGMLCARCEVPLALGDVYCKTPVVDQDGHVDSAWDDIVCMDCDFAAVMALL